MDAPYGVAFLDWLGCAAGGLGEPAARAAARAGSGLLERVTWAGTAGHVLDYDDTYSPGLVHASAPVAPVALLLGAELGRDAGAVLEAHAAGFEATAALARAGHPALYERGWHPTAVCGGVGAAVAAARLLGLTPDQTDTAKAVALLRAGGLRSAFGSDAKALQVGMAAAAGLHAALLAQNGARAPLGDVRTGPAGFEAVFGVSWPQPGAAPAIGENWIKAYPCCLATHSTIEAAVQLRDRHGPQPHATVWVHPLAQAAAARGVPADGLEAKFSLPYTAAFALLHGAPGVSDFRAVDAEARELAARVEVRIDDALGEMAARLETPAGAASVEWPLGSPGRPMSSDALQRKVRDLAGDRLEGVLGDEHAPAARLVAAAGLDGP
jgi:2-methylcitrate dehydratase PrpD